MRIEGLGTFAFGLIIGPIFALRRWRIALVKQTIVDFFDRLKR